jgi:hypothetical protein
MNSMSSSSSSSVSVSRQNGSFGSYVTVRASSLSLGGLVGACEELILATTREQGQIGVRERFKDDTK